MRLNARIAALAAVATAATAGVGIAVAPLAAADAAPGTGSAFGASVSVTLLPGVLGPNGLTVDTGELAPSSSAGPTSNSVADVPLHGVVHARAISSKATNIDGRVNATAEILGASLPVLAPALGATPRADVLRARCTGTPDGVTGSSEVVGLNLGRLGTVPITGKPNQTIDVPQVLRVVINEQVRAADGSLTVTALHVRLLGGSATGRLGSGDIRLASATCGLGTSITPPPTTPPTEPGGGGQGGGGQQGGGGAQGGGGQVSVIPSGAPQTGDGTLADAR